MIRYWLCLPLLLLTACAPLIPQNTATPPTPDPAQPTTQPDATLTPIAPDATIISTGDGDTIRVQQNGAAVTVRLTCIDAPENAQQPYGRQAAEHLAALLPVNSPVTLRVVDTDRYGRTVAEVYREGQSVNLQMVKDGHAVVYTQYLDGCAATKNDYLQAEAYARQQQLAFWSQDNPVMPWDFRRGKREGQPEPDKLEPKPDSAGLPSCINDDCDCGDFSTQAEAQQVLDTFPGDPHRLDRDSNGQACESLP